MILIKAAPDGNKVCHELPIQLGTDSAIVDFDDGVAVLHDDKCVHFVNYSEHPRRNVTHITRKHYGSRRANYNIVGCGGFSFDRGGTETDKTHMRQIVVFYSSEVSIRLLLDSSTLVN